MTLEWVGIISGITILFLIQLVWDDYQLRKWHGEDHDKPE